MLKSVQKSASDLGKSGIRRGAVSLRNSAALYSQRTLDSGYFFLDELTVYLPATTTQAHPERWSMLDFASRSLGGEASAYRAAGNAVTDSTFGSQLDVESLYSDKGRIR